ncbi:hypothetical protein OSTOST_14475 [Ostertagia ostertagi]
MDSKGELVAINTSVDADRDNAVGSLPAPPSTEATTSKELFSRKGDTSEGRRTIHIHDKTNKEGGRSTNGSVKDNHSQQPKGCSISSDARTTLEETDTSVKRITGNVRTILQDGEHIAGSFYGYPEEHRHSSRQASDIRKRGNEQISVMVEEQFHEKKHAGESGLVTRGERHPTNRTTKPVNSFITNYDDEFQKQAKISKYNGSYFDNNGKNTDSMKAKIQRNKSERYEDLEIPRGDGSFTETISNLDQKITDVKCLKETLHGGEFKNFRREVHENDKMRHHDMKQLKQSGFMNSDDHFVGSTVSQKEYVTFKKERHESKRPKDSEILKGDGVFTGKSVKQQDYITVKGERYEVKRPKDSNILRGDDSFVDKTTKQQHPSNKRGERYEEKCTKDSQILKEYGALPDKAGSQQIFAISKEEHYDVRRPKDSDI